MTIIKSKAKKNETEIHRYGYKKDPIDHRDYILHMKINLTTSVANVDLRSNCPAIYNQGNLGSCVSNGTAFSIQYNQIIGHFPHQFTPSRLFIYYNTRVVEKNVNVDSGTTIRGALQVVNKQGACPETLWPYVISQFKTKPPTSAYTSGAQHLVKVYTRLQFTLDQMKQCLIDGYPFIFGMILYTSFNKVTSNGLVPVPNTNEKVLGGHCMACVGFDDSKKHFIVRNSWGTGWGDRGYCYIPYNYMCDAGKTFDLWTIREISDTETAINMDNITAVTYGKKTKFIDVTTKFKNYFVAGNTSLRVSNDLFGDPYFGVVKELRINFINGGVLVFAENNVVYLNDLTTDTLIVRAANIVSAVYGKNQVMLDVTSIVKNHFSKGYSQLTVSNTMFTDPCFGIVKELRLTLSNGTTRIFPEHGLVTINDIIGGTWVPP